MQPRRHRMRQPQRRDSAREWIATGARVTVTNYAQRYGVDRFNAYDDLTALGVALPGSAQQWARRPPTTPRHGVRRGDEQPDDDPWIVVQDGRLFFVAGY